MIIQTSAPGKAMLLGEHAVLRHGKAIVVAIDKRVHVRLSVDAQNLPNNDDWMLYEIKKGKVLEGNSIIQSVIDFFDPPEDFKLEIKSELKGVKGLGSSSALIVALMAAFHKWLDPIDNDQLFLNCLKIVHQVQGGMGSGVDILAAIHGGILYCEKENSGTSYLTKKLSINYPLSLFDTGIKVYTPDVIKSVETKFKNEQKCLDHILSKIDQCVSEGFQAIQSEDWIKLGSIMNHQQALMSELGVSNEKIDRKMKELKKTYKLLGLKLSGAGMGDYLIGLGNGNKINVSGHGVVG